MLLQSRFALCLMISAFFLLGITDEPLLGLYDLFEVIFRKRFECLRPDLPSRGEFRQAVEGCLLVVGSDNEDAVVGSKGPVLSFDCDAGLLGRGVKGVRAFGGMGDFLSPLVGKANESNVAVHNVS